MVITIKWNNDNNSSYLHIPTQYHNTIITSSNKLSCKRNYCPVNTCAMFSFRLHPTLDWPQTPRSEDPKWHHAGGGGSACCFRQEIVDYVESVRDWPDFAMESPELIKNLQARVKELENELKCLKSSNSAAKPATERRGKIAEMSSEVVDSNPYRFGYFCDSQTHDTTM